MFAPFLTPSWAGGDPNYEQANEHLNQETLLT